MEGDGDKLKGEGESTRSYAGAGTPRLLEDELIPVAEDVARSPARDPARPRRCSDDTDRAKDDNLDQ